MLVHYVTQKHISFKRTLATYLISSFWRWRIKSENAAAAVFLHKADLCPQCPCSDLRGWCTGEANPVCPQVDSFALCCRPWGKVLEQCGQADTSRWHTKSLVGSSPRFIYVPWLEQSGEHLHSLLLNADSPLVSRQPCSHPDSFCTAEMCEHKQSVHASTLLTFHTSLKYPSIAEEIKELLARKVQSDSWKPPCLPSCTKVLITKGLLSFVCRVFYCRLG